MLEWNSAYWSIKFFFFRSYMCRYLIWFTLKILKWKKWTRCSWIVLKVLLCITQLFSVFLMWSFDRKKHYALKILTKQGTSHWNLSFPSLEILKTALVKSVYILEIGAISNAVLAHNDCGRQATQTDNRKVKNTNFFVTWFIVSVFLLHC